MHLLSIKKKSMVLFDHLFCGTCEAAQQLIGWGVISSIVDAFVVVAIVILVLGYAIEVPIWLAINIGINIALKYAIGEERPGLCGCKSGQTIDFKYNVYTRGCLGTHCTYTRQATKWV